ncbi:MAG TPA: TIM44-like domain-containing protein [Casimicrobiaceae bacterium]|nr:TIM44-like domain-containing protein [Casimicrobiaceae bacterium]
MKQRALVAIAAATLAAFLISDADARIGGGKSMGVQRQGIVPRASTPPASTPSGAASQPVMPATPGAALPAKPAVPPGPVASGASRWLGPIAGIAAGIGLAALLSHFGLPEGLGTFLLLALLAFAATFVVRILLARRTQSERPLAYAAGRYASTKPAFEMPPAPQSSSGDRVEPTLGSPAQPARSAFPPGFDAAGFARNAKEQFIRLQSAYDAGDREALADVMTPEMMDEILRDLAANGQRRPTKIEKLDAEVFDVETQSDRHWASVRFTGTLREGDGPTVAFDEVWNLTKPADGSSGWLLAGIQQLA